MVAHQDLQIAHQEALMNRWVYLAVDGDGGYSWLSMKLLRGLSPVVTFLKWLSSVSS
jgi:hypothetical protein